MQLIFDSWFCVCIFLNSVFLFLFLITHLHIHIPFPSTSHLYDLIPTGRWCPFWGRMPPPQLILTETPSATHPDTCLLVDSRSNQVANQDESSCAESNNFLMELSWIFSFDWSSFPLPIHHHSFLYSSIFPYLYTSGAFTTSPTPFLEASFPTSHGFLSGLTQWILHGEG